MTSNGKILESGRTASPGDFPASQSPTQESSEHRKTSAGSGPSFSELFAVYDPDTGSLRTSQGCLFMGGTTFSQTLPPSGMMRSGSLYRQQQWGHHTCESGCSLWPTPSAGMHKQDLDTPEYIQYLHEREGQVMLPAAVHRAEQSGAEEPSSPPHRSEPGCSNGSPRRSDADSGGVTQRMCLNPTWVEWLVGMRLGHTAFPD